MTKRALSALAGFFGCCLSLSAQETQRPALFALIQPSPNILNTRAPFSVLNGAYYGFPALTLADGRLISLSYAYDWIEATPPDFLPAVSAEKAPRAKRTTTLRRDSSDKVVEVKPDLFDNVHGEVGALYGRSTDGKFSREVEQGYILGEIGNDKTQISVGAFYEKESGHIPRSGR